MYAIVHRSVYRGGWKLKPKLYKTREIATADADRLVAANGGEFKIVWFDWA